MKCETYLRHYYVSYPLSVKGVKDLITYGQIHFFTRFLISCIFCSIKKHNVEK